MNSKAFLFLSPWLLGFSCFLFGPIIASLVLSFASYDGLNIPKLVGLANYFEMLSDPMFATSLKVTLVYAAITLPLTTIAAISVALLLSQKRFAISAYRTLLYLPSVVPIVASSVVWIWIFKGDNTGLLNNILTSLGIEAGPQWLSDPNWALPALIIMSFWAIGNPIIIYLAGLQNIPESLYEAAELDGASKWKQLWHITLPMLSPTIFFNVVIGIIQVFQFFVPAYVMTSGGPQGSTMFYSLYAYQTAFDYFRMGYASALSWLLFLIVLISTLLAFYGAKRWVHY